LNDAVVCFDLGQSERDFRVSNDPDEWAQNNGCGTDCLCGMTAERRREVVWWTLAVTSTALSAVAIINLLLS
jgi:hypothetical protein